jgi:hypothetical protein
MQSKQIGRHLKRIAQVGVVAGPVLVGLLEKRYPKYGFLGRQALEVIETFGEEGRDNLDSLPTGGEYSPSSRVTRDDYHGRLQFDPAPQNDALSDALRELQEREQLLRAEVAARNASEVAR